MGKMKNKYHLLRIFKRILMNCYIVGITQYDVIFIELSYFHGRNIVISSAKEVQLNIDV